VKKLKININLDLASKNLFLLFDQNLKKIILKYMHNFGLFKGNYHIFFNINKIN